MSPTALTSANLAFPARLERLSDFLWELPLEPAAGMRVPARIYGTEAMIRSLDQAVFSQIRNVAGLPGIVKHALCMPDGHSGYGFPIGGVAAMDPETGVISPGGIGFDINCGMRLVLSRLTESDVRPRIRQLVDLLYRRVPSGVGSAGPLRLSPSDFKLVAEKGSRWCLERGLAWEEDLARTEDGGMSEGADAGAVSERAIERGARHLGTLGSGNHYLEIQIVRPENIRDPERARQLGLFPGQAVIMFHCGSRGFGHQIASDYLKIFLGVMESKYGIQVRDRELAAAPFRSPEGQAYFAAMKCAINMSFANRQVILHRIREVFSEVFSQSAESLGLRMVHDIAHNTAKIESHRVDGVDRQLLVHRKGATRAFPAQPVIIGGSMETGSYLLTGVESGGQSFFSTAHGSGRIMSRHQAKRTWDGRDLARSMEARGIYVKSASFAGLAEEAGGAYKNIDEVVDVTTRAGLSAPIARLIPIGNIKG